MLLSMNLGTTTGFAFGEAGCVVSGLWPTVTADVLAGKLDELHALASITHIHIVDVGDESDLAKAAGLWAHSHGAECGDDPETVAELWAASQADSSPETTRSARRRCTVTEGRAIAAFDSIIGRAAKLGAGQ